MRVSLAVLVLGVLLGGLVGTGWAVWGDIKGQHALAIVIGVVGGAALSLPIIAYMAADILATTSCKKALVLLVPIFLVSFCLPYYGGLIMFLQLCAILLPSFLVKNPWATLLLALGGGFAFLGLWFMLYSRGIAPIDSDDIFVFYPYAIVVVAIDVAIGRAIGRRYKGEQPAMPRAAP